MFFSSPFSLPVYFYTDDVYRIAPPAKKNIQEEGADPDTGYSLDLLKQKNFLFVSERSFMFSFFPLLLPVHFYTNDIY